jgi:hypothetical protein
MVRGATLTCAVLLIASVRPADAQQTDAAAELVSTWLLVGAERDVGSGAPGRVQGARGLRRGWISRCRGRSATA